MSVCMAFGNLLLIHSSGRFWIFPSTSEAGVLALRGQSPFLLPNHQPLDMRSQGYVTVASKGFSYLVKTAPGNEKSF